MSVRDVMLECSNAGGQCLYLDGNGTVSGGFGNFLTRLSVFENVPMQKSSTGDAVYVRLATAMEFRNCIGAYDSGAAETAGITGNVTLRNPGFVVFKRTGLGIVGGASLDYQYDNALSKPLNGRVGVYLTDLSTCKGTVVFSKSPLFVMDTSAALNGNISDAGLSSYTSGPLHAPVLIFAGAVGSPSALATITLALPAITSGGSTIPYVNLSGTFYGAITISSLATGPAGFTHNYVDGRGGRFRSGTITAGAATIIDVRGGPGNYSQAQFAAAGSPVGVIDRDLHTVSVSVINGTTGVTITPGFPASTVYPYTLIGAVTYFVTYELATAIATPTTTTKTSTGFNVVGTAAGTATAIIQRRS